MEPINHLNNYLLFKLSESSPIGVIKNWLLCLVHLQLVTLSGPFTVGYYAWPFTVGYSVWFIYSWLLCLVHLQLVTLSGPFTVGYSVWFIYSWLLCLFSFFALWRDCYTGFLNHFERKISIVRYT